MPGTNSAVMKQFDLSVITRRVVSMWPYVDICLVQAHCGFYVCWHVAIFEYFLFALSCNFCGHKLMDTSQLQGSWFDWVTAFVEIVCMLVFGLSL